jgi:hypothetical protein
MLAQFSDLYKFPTEFMRLMSVSNKTHVSCNTMQYYLKQNVVLLRICPRKSEY